MTHPPLLEVAGLTVAYDGEPAVDDLDLTAGEGEVLAVLGPSGCGKSTLLRAVAGLETPTAGRIRLGGTDLAGRRPDERAVGLMFQDHALFPHRTVAQNVAFGPRMQGLSRSEVATRVEESLDLVALEDAGARPVGELSGGEQQRVALARALAPRPRLLMLDEPLGSLDRTLRDRLLDELPRVFARVGTTVLYVTHDHDEALALADRVAVMRAGRLEQVGAPETLWQAPQTAFVARFLGFEPILEASVAGGRAATALGELHAPGLPDGPTHLVLLPDALRLLSPADGARSGEGEAPAGGEPVPRRDEVVVTATVEHRRFARDRVVLRVRSDADVPLWVPVWGGAGPAVGASVRVGVDPSRLRPVREQ